jgi:hypothetical protein
MRGKDSVGKVGNGDGFLVVVKRQDPGWRLQSGTSQRECRRWAGRVFGEDVIIEGRG